MELAWSRRSLAVTDTEKKLTEAPVQLRRNDRLIFSSLESVCKGEMFPEVLDGDMKSIY